VAAIDSVLSSLCTLCAPSLCVLCVKAFLLRSPQMRLVPNCQVPVPNLIIDNLTNMAYHLP